MSEDVTYRAILDAIDALRKEQAAMDEMNRVAAGLAT